MGAATYRFGPFELRTASRTLLRDGEPLAIMPRHAAILILLVSKAGLIVARDEAIAAGWKGDLIGDNSVDKAISDLRRMLGVRSEGGPYIETVRRRGFRFNGEVSSADTVSYAASVAAVAHTVEGRRALQTMDRAEVARGRVEYEEAVRATPKHAPAHAGLSRAWALQYEATRADGCPDQEALARALEHAHIACALDPGLPEASASLAFALSLAGQHTDALIAAKQANLLEKGNWQFETWLANVAWGQETLGAVRRAAAQVSLPVAHLLAARVYIARQTFADAERELVAGIAAYDSGGTEVPFGGVGLHWLYGLVRLALGDLTGAEAALRRELAFEHTGQIYAREIAAHTRHATGAVRLRASDAAGAVDAFEAALALVPAHPLAHVGLVIAKRRMSGEALPLELPDAASGSPVDVAMARAALLVEAGRATEAVALVAEAVASSAVPRDGWFLPLEPLLGVMRAPDVWRLALAKVRGRAM